MSTSVKVQSLPDCDMCGETASYDAATSFGAWANLCQNHFRQFGLGLGTGRGQKLELIK